MSSSDWTWDPPGPGVWWLTLEHLPAPVSVLFAELFPQITIGWQRGAARYGMFDGPARWGVVNNWMYYSAGPADPATLPALEDAARRALDERIWRAEVDRWFGEERPAVVAANLVLQGIDLEALDDLELADHFTATADHFCDVGALHFEHRGFGVVGGLLFRAAKEKGMGPAEVASLLAGASPASSDPTVRLQRIRRALDRSGASSPATLDDVRAASSEATAELDDYLTMHGWRLMGSHDPVDPALAERPDLIIKSIRTATGRAVTDRAVTDRSVTDRSSESGTAFDGLLDDVRRCYALGDDDGGVCFAWPLGLVRRAVLEAGRRLRKRGGVRSPRDLFETTTTELRSALEGSGPSAEELADRSARRRAAATVDPPIQLGQSDGDRPQPDLPPAVAEVARATASFWVMAGAQGRGRLHGTGIGAGRYEGRACVLGRLDPIGDLQPGDVLVALATTSAHNSAFPLAGAVATQEGGLFSHAAILSRELGLPAVVGVAGLLAGVANGDIVEVDASAGTVRVVPRE